MKSIKELKVIKGKRIVVRVDFNVPMTDGKITDDFRIKKAIPTISYLQKKGAIVVLIAHLGEDGSQSLAPIAQRLKRYIPEVEFISSPLFSSQTDIALERLKSGSVVLLENIRREGDEKKNTPSFGRALSRMGEMYVNDAFSVSHRLHASIVGIPKHIEGYAGFQLLEEIKGLNSAFSPKHPFLFILGGAKFETKIPLIKKFLKNADTVYIAGALANDFFRAKGYEIGQSLVDQGNFNLSSLMKNKNLVLPSDVETVKGKSHRFTKATAVERDESIIDIGPESLKALEEHIKKAKFILWNGPLGKDNASTISATEKLLKIIAKNKVESVIGGGDTVALISKLKIEDQLGFVSTGGGAALDFLATGTLPGIKALK